jgi:hypothetical protein
MPAASDVRFSGRDQGISRPEAVNAGRPLLTQSGHRTTLLKFNSLQVGYSTETS